MPPAPTRIVRVFEAMCSMRTLVADDAMVGHVVVLGVPDAPYPSSSARWASFTLASKASAAV